MEIYMGEEFLKTYGKYNQRFYSKVQHPERWSLYLNNHLNILKNIYIVNLLLSL